MRDGMPGPGWWIASDGRWYPPELHPDVRASTAVALAESKPAARVIDEHPTSLFDVHHDVPNGTATVLAPERSTNGSSVATAAPDALVATPLVEPLDEAAEAAPVEAAPVEAAPIEAVPVEAVPIEAVLEEAPVAARTAQQRFRLALGLGVGTLLLIVYLAGGHDLRPSLGTNVATTVITGAALPAPTTSAETAAQRTAASSTTTTHAATATSPGSAASPANTASTTTSRPSTTPTTTVAKVTPHVVSVFDLVKGDCLDGAGLTDGLVTTIRVVDCSEVHTHEVYYSGRYPDPTFDATKINNYADDTCLTQFATYVGVDYAGSRYQYLHIVPTQESWTRDNDRDVVCVAFEEDATITGSIAGRAQ